MISTMGISEKIINKLSTREADLNHKCCAKGRTEAVNGDQISRPGPRIDDGLKALRDAIYNEK